MVGWGRPAAIIWRSAPRGQPSSGASCANECGGTQGSVTTVTSPNATAINETPCRRARPARPAAIVVELGRRARRSGEHLVAVPAITAAKAALALALAESGLSRVALAQRLRVDEKAVRRMLDPRHRTAIARIERALRVLGQDLVVETRAA